MTHEIEYTNGVPNFVFANEPCWHGIGVQIGDDLTPDEMRIKAGLDWTVEKYPATIDLNGVSTGINRSALVRSSDNKILDIVTDPWEVTQNKEAFDFFYDLVKFGQMKMECAGSLKGGQIVFALAKTTDTVTLWGKDQIDAYLLFSNPHLFGKSREICFTGTRVCCFNTLTMALEGTSVNRVKSSHRTKFDPEEAKELLGLAKDKLQSYKEVAMFLGEKRYNPLELEQYIKTLFPVVDVEGTAKKEISKNAKIVMDLVETSPGAEFVPGSWWNVVNSVTYFTDHLASKTQDVRLASAWFGVNRTLKNKAMNSAIKFAKAA